MSLTEALRAGAPEAFGRLYDEHAGRLYAYCRLMVDGEAAEAVRDTFIAAARHPETVPDDEALPVWLHALARAECVRRGALVRKAPAAPDGDPLPRTLARLRPEHREALALSAALEIDEVATVIGLAPDTAEMLVRMARRRLEQSAASVLGARAVHDEAMINALGAGTLHKLVTRGYEPPPRLRQQALFSCAAAERSPDGALLFDQEGMPVPLDGSPGPVDDATRPITKITDADTEILAAAGAPAAASHGRNAEPAGKPAPAATASEPATGGKREATVIRIRPGKESFGSRRRDNLVEAAGLAACVAVAAGVLALWPGPHGNGASNVDGTSVLINRGMPASRLVQPPRSTPQQGNTSKAGASPSATPTSTAPSATPGVPAPSSAASPPGKPGSPGSPGGGPVSGRPTPPTSPTPTPTPTPTGSPTGSSPSPSATPTPSPS